MNRRVIAPVILDIPSAVHDRSVVTLGPVVFLSHAGSDKELVRATYALVRYAFHLEPQQIRCTSYAKSSLEPLAPLVGLCEEAAQADLFLCLLTPYARESEFVLHELGAAMTQRAKAIVFVACGQTFHNLPPVLNGLNLPNCNSADVIDQAMRKAAKILNIALNTSGIYDDLIEIVVSISDERRLAAENQRAKESRSTEEF